MDKPNWKYWVNLADVELRQAVELSCNIAPGSMDSLDADRYLQADVLSIKREVETRLSIARSHVKTRNLPVDHRSSSISDPPYFGGDYMSVKLVDFHAWAESLPNAFDLPDEFPRGEPQAVEEPQRRGTNSDKLLDTRERTTLLCIIGALANEAKVDLEEPYKAGEVVAKMLPNEVKLSPRTIGNHLKSVREALESRKT